MKKHNMKPIVNLMDKSIKKSSKLIPNEHQMRCNSCGQIMDLRDLSQVFAHEECNGNPINYDTMKQIPYSGAQKIGSSELHTKNNGVINLN